MDKTAQGIPQSTIEYSRTDDFRETYANNVFLESSFWDLKLIFGHTDQSLGPNAIIQNLAVTLSWSQLKVLKYFLDSHLIAHEVQNGRIHIIPTLIPPVPNQIPPELLKQNPQLGDIHIDLKAMYDACLLYTSRCV